MHALKRKFSQLCADPVLRAWLFRRALSLQPAAPPFAPHLPPYLWDMLPLESPNAAWPGAETRITGGPTADPVTLPLAGAEIPFDPKDPDAFFDQPVPDIEVDLARHRFAWLPMCPGISAPVFAQCWQAWRKRFGAVAQDSMYWHPYTTSERAINIIDAVRRMGLPSAPEDLAADLARHAVLISERLEYFGDHDTSNHLANNGRGLYRIGSALGDDATRTLGFEILSREATRIFLPGGTLREGSSHYHLLYLRNYLDVWFAAARHGHDTEAATLRAIAGELMEAARHLVLPGGVPCIGDISPDCPPSFLTGLEAGKGAWAATLDADDRERLKSLADIVENPSSETSLSDGWLRVVFGRWSALAHVPEAGWPFMPGHAHQDMGSAEVHLDGEPLFVDPGRGCYGEDGDAALYRSAAVHGTLRIDGGDPYPPNKPYYDDAFRARHAGPAAAMIHADGFTIAHGGYRRLGADDVRRRWQFDDTGFRIEDGISGKGKSRHAHTIERALVTPLDVRIENGAAVIDGRIAVSCQDAEPRLDNVTVWQAYHTGTPATRIVFETRTSLPWSGVITVREIT